MLHSTPKAITVFSCSVWFPCKYSSQVMKTSRWRQVPEQEVTGKLSQTESSGSFGKLFAYLNDIRQDERTPAEASDSHWPGTSCCSVDTGNICERVWTARGKIPLSAKHALGTARSRKAWRSRDNTNSAAQKAVYTGLIMTVSGPSRRASESSVLTVTRGPKVSKEMSAPIGAWGARKDLFPSQWTILPT